MLQFDAAPVATSNAFSVNGEQFLSRNREMLGDMRDGGREAPPVRPRAGASQQNVSLPHLVIEFPVTMIVRGAPTRETRHAKFDDDDNVPAPSRQFGGDGADGWFAKSSRTSTDELGPAIATGRRTYRPPTTAR
jgi:hypothetical protein